MLRVLTVMMGTVRTAHVHIMCTRPRGRLTCDYTFFDRTHPSHTYRSHTPQDHGESDDEDEYSCPQHEPYSHGGLDVDGGHHFYHQNKDGGSCVGSSRHQSWQQSWQQSSCSSLQHGAPPPDAQSGYAHGAQARHAARGAPAFAPQSPRGRGKARPLEAHEQWMAARGGRSRYGRARGQAGGGGRRF